MELVEFELFCSSLIGLKLTHMWQGYGSGIFLDLDPLSHVVDVTARSVTRMESGRS